MTVRTQKSYLRNEKFKKQNCKQSSRTNWSQYIPEFKTAHIKIFQFVPKKYITDQLFKLLESNTDFIYFNMNKQNLDNCVLPYLKENY